MWVNNQTGLLCKYLADSLGEYKYAFAWFWVFFCQSSISLMYLSSNSPVDQGAEKMELQDGWSYTI